MQQPAVADADPVEPGTRCVRAVLSEHRDAHGHESRGKVRGADVPLFERAGPEVLDEHVGRRGEPAQEVLAVGGAQVERHALASAAFDRPEERVLAVVARVDERTELAHEVAAARLLDLDDVGALFAEQARAERRGDARAEVEDAQARERAAQRSACGRRAVSPCSRLTASMPPCLRASTFASAVGVFDTNWWSMKW